MSYQQALEAFSEKLLRAKGRQLTFSYADNSQNVDADGETIQCLRFVIRYDHTTQSFIMNSVHNDCAGSGSKGAGLFKQFLTMIEKLADNLGYSVIVKDFANMRLAKSMFQRDGYVALNTNNEVIDRDRLNVFYRLVDDAKINANAMPDYGSDSDKQQRKVMAYFDDVLLEPVAKRSAGVRAAGGSIASSRHTHNKRSYKIRTGSRGGRYIVVSGRKLYV